jgi:hypothetical protein
MLSSNLQTKIVGWFCSVDVNARKKLYLLWQWFCVIAEKRSKTTNEKRACFLFTKEQLKFQPKIVRWFCSVDVYVRKKLYLLWPSFCIIAEKTGRTTHGKRACFLFTKEMLKLQFTTKDSWMILFRLCLCEVKLYLL